MDEIKSRLPDIPKSRVDATGLNGKCPNLDALAVWREGAAVITKLNRPN
jgi:hypothetical protein